VRAVVTTAPGQPLAVTEAPDPSPAEHELVIAVTRCGICGSDLHNGHLAPQGQILGHEMAGEIVAVGTGATDRWREGQRVAVFPLVGCGRCAACLTGRTQRCPSVSLVGFTRPGGFAEYLAVGAHETAPLPDLLSDAEGALVEPLAVGLYAFRRTEVRAGEPLLIIGGGPVGLAVLVWARHLGVGQVVVSEPAPGRRATAEALGAATIDPGAEDVGSAFQRLTGRRPSAVVECAGRPGVVDQAMLAAGDDARITVAGLCTQPDQVSHLAGLLKGLTVRYVLYYERADYDTTLQLLADDRFDPDPLITDTIDLAALPERFEALKHPSTDVPFADVKVQVDPRR
jgi:(R,R)-butanediol dehydrogenase / meso-butanediol dehydrogenase / diacetyl reductase